MYGEGEGKFASSIVLQLSLGTCAALNTQVSLGADSAQCVDKTCTLLTGRCLHTGVSIDNRHSSAHQQCISHGTHGSVVSLGELFLQVLQQQSGNTGDLRTSHGGTGHDAVIATVVAGEHITADTSDIGQQTQVRSSAPAGEGAHLAA